MDIADLRKLVARGEDSRLQYKSDVRNVDALAAEMAAFANCEGGQILIGVGDNGELNGRTSQAFSGLRAVLCRRTAN